MCTKVCGFFDWFDVLKIDKNDMMAVMYIPFSLRMLATISKYGKNTVQNKSFSGLNVSHERFFLTVIPVLLISSVALVLCYLLLTIAMSVANPASSDKIFNLWPD